MRAAIPIRVGPAGMFTSAKVSAANLAIEDVTAFSSDMRPEARDRPNRWLSSTTDPESQANPFAKACQDSRTAIAHLIHFIDEFDEKIRGLRGFISAPQLRDDCAAVFHHLTAQKKNLVLRQRLFRFYLALSSISDWTVSVSRPSPEKPLKRKASQNELTGLRQPKRLYK